MASKKGSVNSVPLKHLNRQLERYTQAVIRKSYTALGEVSKDAVQTVKAAVIAAPPTKMPRGPSGRQRKLRTQQLPDMPLVRNGAVATGKYRDAWRAKRMRQGSRMGIFIFNTTAQGPIVEYGRKPGKMPPVQAIRKWLQVKFSLPYRRARRLAWPIAKAIKRDGIPARAVLFSDNTNMMLGFYMEEAISKAQLAAALQVFK